MIHFSERRDTTRNLFISRVTQDEKGLEFAVRCESPKASSAAVSCWIIGRGERIRTTDLTVPNRWSGKNVSLCLFKSCSHRRFSRVLHSFPSATARYTSRAGNSVHKLATRDWTKAGVFEHVVVNP